MDKDKIIEIVNDSSNRPNKDLIDARDFLLTEFKKTKEYIIEMTRHLDAVKHSYEIINNEIEKRLK